ncbi:MAG: sigma 54-interacting transcriptional regulator [Desulfobacterales bacterium]|nr:sigma 54-interacting transcriptional regulator [Desulfobacterales bacterium]
MREESPSLKELKDKIQQLTEEIDTLNACLMSAGVGLWDWNIVTDGVDHHMNDFKLLGYDETIQDTSDEGWLAHIYPEDLRTHFAEVQATQGRSRKEFDFNFRVRNRRRDTRWIASRGHVVAWDENGRPARMVGSHVDQTQQKIFENKLKEAESHLEAVVETLKGSTYVASIDYRLEFMNKKLFEEVGFDAMGSICHQTLYGLDHPCPWCTMHEVMRDKTAHIEYENTLRQKWYYSIATPVHKLDGRISIKSTFIDITAQKTGRPSLDRPFQKEAKPPAESTLLASLSKHKTANGFSGIVGQSKAIQKTYELIAKASQSNASVVIYGESGTGKELVARAIHECSANIRDRFVAINCGAIPDNLIESEFFGYTRGAFSGAKTDTMGYLEAADGGTLFLDEVGEIDLNMQVKLLRVIEGYGFVPLGGKKLKRPLFRLITATNRDLFERIQKGKMRKDFFFRINVFPIELPPLRDRKEDLPLLVAHFLKLFNAPDHLVPLPDLHMKALWDYHWPGNIRELQNLIHRYVAVGEMNPERDLAEALPAVRPQENPLTTPQEQSLKEIMQGYEKRVLIEILDQNQWQKAKVARQLGINRKTLFEKIRKYKLAPGHTL